MSDQTVPQRRPVVYRPESAVFWVFVVALILGTLALLDDSGPVIRATLDANIALSWLWLLFIAFMVWLIFRFDPFRSGRRYPQALVAVSHWAAPQRWRWR
ncbi:hypothetical protein [Mycolicibacterium novocastrense]|uniref:Uncharacterized protein n=1 Tax=Mycolicibacterium novocastrense TaxID=59813 RepID=A0ABQ0KT12_MYCNV|nr:hypothetical protein [Mycolicibacterium novocastrense]GAT12432.1 uncharacterized protein RMCN_5565 [Mycolicibacterium novocastrense]